MKPSSRSVVFNFDKLVILAFTAFLWTDEANEMLINSGLKWVYLLLLASGIAYVLTPVFLLVAHRLDIIDEPRGRHTHLEPTALLGGVAIFFAFALAIWHNNSFSVQLKSVFIGSVLILIVGVWDDIKGISAWIKLIVQLAVVGILISQGVVISFLPNTIWGNISEWVLTAIWIIGITNAVNFLDGMDGLASGMAAIIAMIFGLIALQNGQDTMVYLALPLVGACLGFLPYNFRLKKNALIFLGDGGSTFLGFMLASLAIIGDWAGNYTVRLILPLLILGVPIFDMTFTTFMRVKNGQVRSLRQWIDFTGRDHIHHRLAELRIGHVGAVVVIYIVTIWLGLSALALKNSTGLNAILQISQSLIVFILMGFFMVFVPHEYKKIEQDRTPESKDELTKLDTFAYLETQMDFRIAEAKRYGYPFALLIIDIDNFKKLNDKSGKVFGDYVLISIADMIRKEVREGDVFSRYQGGSFALIIPYAALVGIRFMGDRIRTEIEKSVFKMEDISSQITVSIGAALYPLDLAEKSKDLLLIAQSRLYQAKNTGGNRSVYSGH